MTNKNPDEEIENEGNGQIDEEVREYAEQLPGFQEYQREQRGDSLNFGDM